MKILFTREESAGNEEPHTQAGCKNNYSRVKKSKSHGRQSVPNPKGTFLCSLESGDDCKLSIYDEANPKSSRFKKGVSRKQILLELCEVLKKAAESTEEESFPSELNGMERLTVEDPTVEDPHPGGVSFITVYPGIDRSYLYVEVTPKDLSVVVVTDAGEVYGKGWNSLHRCPFQPPAVPMKEGRGNSLPNFVKIDMFEGLRIKKIALDEFFGVALTLDRNLYLWGIYKGPRTDLCVMFEEYRPGKCHCGKTRGKSQLVGVAQLSFCPHGKSGFKVYTAADPPPPGVPVRTFFLYDRATVACPICHKHAIPSLASYNGYKLSCCPSCKQVFEAENTSTQVYVKVPVKIDGGIIDMDCTRELIWTLSENNSLQVRKYDVAQSAVLRVELSPGEVMKTVNCGQCHVAVVTNKGNVFCYGLRGNEDPKCRSRENRLSAISLWRVSVPGLVQKVNCGRFSIICLLDDGSVCIIGKDGVVLPVGSNLAFTSVAAKPLLDIVYRLKYPFFGKLGKENLKNLEAFEELMSSLSLILSGSHVGKLPWPLPAQLEQELLPRQQQPNSQSRNSQLPEQNEVKGLVKETITELEKPLQLSDSQFQKSQPDCQNRSKGLDKDAILTIELADGVYKANSSILASSSDYFRKILSSSIPSTLNMTFHNPKAYRCFIHRLCSFTPPGAHCCNLCLDDLLDLLDIALAYNETAIVDDVVRRLIAEINPGSVVRILSRTVPFALIEACKAHVCSAEFRMYLSNTLMKDPNKNLVFLP